MKVLYCIGEKAEEIDDWDKVLTEQLEIGLDGCNTRNVVVGYEPVWSIGPGKTPADKAYITKVARLIKQVVPGIDVVYGGGLKKKMRRCLRPSRKSTVGSSRSHGFPGRSGSTRSSIWKSSACICRAKESRYEAF